MTSMKKGKYGIFKQMRPNLFYDSRKKKQKGRNTILLSSSHVLHQWFYCSYHQHVGVVADGASQWAGHLQPGQTGLGGSQTSAELGRVCT